MRRFLLPLFGVLLLSMLAGCGGGSGSPSVSSRGVIQVHLTWPERSVSRQIPAGANSVRVTIRATNGNVVTERLLVRPTSSDVTTTETFELPATQLQVTAVAFPNADGTGTALAETATVARVSNTQPTDLNLTMQSTITTVKITPENIPLTGLPVLLTATAYDAENNMVLTDRWEWKNSNDKVLTLKPNGSTAILTAVGTGTTEISVTEIESQVTQRRPFHVAPLP